MNLDELTKNIRKISKEEIVKKLADNIQEWKTDERNAVELRDTCFWSIDYWTDHFLTLNKLKSSRFCIH